MSELAEQMKAHGITDPWDLTEFDQWVNEATRTDIVAIAEKRNYEVFGLELWGEWKKIRGRELVGALNFSVDLISEYGEQTEKEWSMEADKKLVDQLFELALMSCTWV